MESWMVSFGLALAGGIGIFAVLRSNVQRLAKVSDKIVDDITSIEKKMVQFSSMREVREEFVSKELFAQMQKHFDDRFKRVENGITKILTKLEK